MYNRAVAGGQTGKNGEFYKGGTFLPSTTLPKRSSQSCKAKTRKVLVEPGVLAELPEGCGGSIFGTYRELISVQAGTAYARDCPDAVVKAYINKDVEAGRATLVDLVKAYNAGSRWLYRDGGTK